MVSFGALAPGAKSRVTPQGVALTFWGWFALSQPEV